MSVSLFPYLDIPHTFCAAHFDMLRLDECGDLKEAT